MKSWLGLLLLTTLLGGCKTLAEHRADFVASNNSFIGQSTDQLVLQRGVPTGTYTLTTGEQLLEFKSVNNFTTGGYSYKTNETQQIDGKKVKVPVTETVPLKMHSEECVMTFSAEKHIVKSWTWKGDGCYPSPNRCALYFC